MQIEKYYLDENGYTRYLLYVDGDISDQGVNEDELDDAGKVYESFQEAFVDIQEDLHFRGI